MTHAADRHIYEVQWDAARMLAEHSLLGETYWDEGRGARWCIGQPGTFVHRVEVIAGIGGSLVVHGDFDTVRFASYGDRQDAWSRLRWMADCRDVSYYVRQKASIGRSVDVDVYDEDVARAELRQMMADELADGDPALVDVLEEALTHAETLPELRRFLSEHDDGWDLWEWSFGMVLQPHVVISHVALNKCAWLLRERHGPLGPPECRVTAEEAADGP